MTGPGQPTTDFAFTTFTSPAAALSLEPGSLWTVEREIERLRAHSLDRPKDGLTG